MYKLNRDACDVQFLMTFTMIATLERRQHSRHLNFLCSHLYHSNGLHVAMNNLNGVVSVLCVHLTENKATLHLKANQIQYANEEIIEKYSLDKK